MDIIYILLFFVIATIVVFKVGDFYFNDIKKNFNEKHEEKKWKERLKEIQKNSNDE